MNSILTTPRNGQKVAAWIAAGAIAFSLGVLQADAADAAIVPAPPAGPEAVNIAPTGTATASSYYSHAAPDNPTAGNYVPQNVIDGVLDVTKRWVSSYQHAATTDGYPYESFPPALVNASWIRVDLPAPATVSEVVIDWDNNCSNEYKVQVSPDGVNWTTAESFGRAQGACNLWGTLVKSYPVSTATPVKAVRMVSTLARSGTVGMTINEIYIYGENGWAYSPAAPSSWPAGEAKNLSRDEGVVASAKSQAKNSSATAGTNTPAYGTRTENWAPAHAVDGLAASRWNSDYAGVPVGNTYNPTNDWFQVKLPSPQPVYQTHIEWAAASTFHMAPSSATAAALTYTRAMKPTRYSIQVSADQDCSSWETVARVANPFDSDDQIVAAADPVWCVRAQASPGFAPATLGYAIAEFEVWSGPRPASVTGRILPVPVEQTPGAGGPFTLGTGSRIVVSDAELAALGGTVAGQLRPATGYALPVVTGAARPGDVALVKAPVAELPADNDVAAAEGYKLAVSSAGALLTAPTEHGLFNAFQSLRQLLPAAVYAETARLVAWTVAPTTVVDYPRYGYRGLQIDPARNFIQVDEVKAIIDEVAAVKTNVLHMRLSDTQAWRFEVKAPADAPDKYRNLERYATGQMYTNSSNRGCEGVGCITGFYTQDDFKEIVAYANAQYVEILPELEGPGHATGAVVALNRTMACTGSGMSNFCAVPGNAATEAALQFWRDAIGQLAAISTGPAIHIGGDYVTGVTLTDYRYWIAQMEQIVNENGKTAVSYNPGLDGYQNPDSVNQYYSDYSPPAWGQQAAPGWFDHGRPTIVMPDNNTYLAHPYSGTPASGTNAMEAMKVWNWDPEWFVERYRDYNVSQVAWGGPRPEDIVGVEASVAGENMRGRLPNEYMIFPRFAGIAEKAWSPRALTQDHGAYQARLKAQGARWSYQGVNFGTIPETEWGAEASGAVVDFGPDLRVEGAELAALAAPGVDYTAVTATVDWGDGSPVSAAAVSGTDYLPASRAGRSLITATADHAYAAPGALGGTVTFAWDGQSVTVPFGTERGFDVAVTLLPRCVVGQVYLYGSVKNNDEVPLDVTITTAYGSKTVANVTPGRSGSGTFAVKAASVGDGSGSVAVTPSQGAPSERLEVPASYAGVGCG